jgi:hypothetical protein
MVGVEAVGRSRRSLRREPPYIQERGLSEIFLDESEVNMVGGD